MTKPLALLVLPAIGAVLMAATVLPPWQAELESQIAERHGCEVAGLGKVRLSVVNGKEAITARVRCTDKRVFEASRTGPGTTPFEFKECRGGSC